MPGELEPALRLLQAVAYPGDGVLLKGRRVVLSSAEPAWREKLALIGAELQFESAVTIATDGGRIACIAKDGEHTLVVAVPSTMDPHAMHAKMKKALLIYAIRTEPAGWIPSSGRGGGGASGAPAELFVGKPRTRPS